MTRRKVVPVKSVNIIKVILSGVHQLYFVPVVVGLLGGAVGPHCLDGRQEVRLEAQCVLLVFILLDQRALSP